MSSQREHCGRTDDRPTTPRITSAEATGSTPASPAPWPVRNRGMPRKPGVPVNDTESRTVQGGSLPPTMSSEIEGELAICHQLSILFD
jgi:hypothetical protein